MRTRLVRSHSAGPRRRLRRERPGGRCGRSEHGLRQRDHRVRLALDLGPDPRGGHLHGEGRRRRGERPAPGAQSRFPTTTSAPAATRYPVLYLFHGGAGGNSAQWTTGGGAVEPITNNRPLITVMPDGGKVGWYTNWVNQQGGAQNWADFHIGQLIPWIDANLRTIAAKSGRAIAGLSMGGFGAVRYAQDRPDMFAYAASFSGAVDLGDSGTRSGDHRAGRPERLQPVRPVRQPVLAVRRDLERAQPGQPRVAPERRRGRALRRLGHQRPGRARGHDGARPRPASTTRSTPRACRTSIGTTAPARRSIRLRRRPQLRLLELRAQRRDAADRGRAAGSDRSTAAPFEPGRRRRLRERRASGRGPAWATAAPTTGPASRAPAPATAGSATRPAGTTCTRRSASPPTAPTRSRPGSAPRQTTPTATWACGPLGGQVVGETALRPPRRLHEGDRDGEQRREHRARRLRRPVGERRHLGAGRRRERHGAVTEEARVAGLF